MTSIKEIFIKRFDEFALKADKVLLNSPEYLRHAQLYHYTSLEAIEGMIKSQSIRASSIFLMNDPNELVYGQKHYTSKFSNILPEQLRELYEGQSINNLSAFIFSLSELNDDMNQWEKYGNKHKGIRIGFTPENLLKFWKQIDNINVFLVPVVYHTGSNYLDPYGRIFNEMESDFISDVNTYFNINENTIQDLNELKFFCSILSSMMKRKEWSSEKEWRIICFPNGVFHKNIHGNFLNGKSNIYLENKTVETLKMFTNDGHDSVASKDILKIGCNAGDDDHIGYILSLLYNKQVIMQVSQSDIQTR